MIFFFLSTSINLDILLSYKYTVCLLWMNVYCPVSILCIASVSLLDNFLRKAFTNDSS